jgi:predicted nucleic acid-binding protein
MSEAFVLDAWALLAFLQGEQPAATRVRQVIEAAQNHSLRLMVSIINIGEVYYRIGRKYGQKEADEVLSNLRLLPTDILPAEDEIVLAAARLKMVHVLAYADAFAAIAAQQNDATLLTGDPELLEMVDVVRIEKLSRQR